jgi:hypothetical protein
VAPSNNTEDPGIGDGTGKPVAFVRPGRPPTANKNLRGKGAKVQEEFAGLYVAAGGQFSEGHRYGVVYYFVQNYRPATDADAGNVSKRIWDGLEGAAYKDDHVVRFQIAGLVETGRARWGEVAFEHLDLTDVPQSALEELLELVGGGTKHVIYVEIGPVRPAMFSFNLSRASGEVS